MATKPSTIEFIESKPVADLVAAFIDKGVAQYEAEAAERGGATAIDKATMAVGRRAISQLGKIEDAA